MAQIWPNFSNRDQTVTEIAKESPKESFEVLNGYVAYDSTGRKVPVSA